MECQCERDNYIMLPEFSIFSLNSPTSLMRSDKKWSGSICSIRFPWIVELFSRTDHTQILLVQNVLQCPVSVSAVVHTLCINVLDWQAQTWIQNFRCGFTNAACKVRLSLNSLDLLTALQNASIIWLVT